MNCEESSYIALHCPTFGLAGSRFRYILRSEAPMEGTFIKAATCENGTKDVAGISARTGKGKSQCQHGMPNVD